MATSAGWDGTLNAIFDDTDCKLPDSEIGETGENNFLYIIEETSTTGISRLRLRVKYYFNLGGPLWCNLISDAPEPICFFYA